MKSLDVYQSETLCATLGAKEFIIIAFDGSERMVLSFGEDKRARELIESQLRSMLSGTDIECAVSFEVVRNTEPSLDVVMNSIGKL